MDTKEIKLAVWLDDKGKKKSVTILKYLDFVQKQDKNSIAEFLYQRLHSRYLTPFQFTDKKYKNGFSIMANCCLLIETLQSFKNGWGSTHGKSEQAFKDFFLSETNFIAFKKKEKEFYVNVRCGILHQGETSGGWKINRKGKNIFDNTNLTVDSITFAKEIEQSLKNYSEKLIKSPWDSECWDNFRTKMRKVISNCEIKK